MFLKKTKEKKDVNKPKRGVSAFMLWLNEMRETIKRDNPGITVTEIAKKGGEMWKEQKDKSKWEAMAAKEKQRYMDEMRTYKDKDAEAFGGMRRTKPDRMPYTSPSKKSANTSGSNYKSKEYISEDDSDSSKSTEKKKNDDKEDSKSSDQSDDSSAKSDKNVSHKVILLN